MVLKKARPATLTGIIIPADWNERHELIAVALATADEKEYRIGGGRKGKELLELLHRQVEVNGALAKDENGKEIVTVRSYILK